MCFTVSTTTQKAKTAIREYLKNNAGIQVLIDFDIMPDMHLVSGFSHPDLPIIKQGVISLGEWGLIPSFAVTEETANDIRNKTLNARSYTIYRKPSYKKSILNQRCILIVDVFLMDAPRRKKISVLYLPQK